MNITMTWGRDGVSVSTSVDVGTCTSEGCRSSDSNRNRLRYLFLGRDNYLISTDTGMLGLRFRKVRVLERASRD